MERLLIICLGFLAFCSCAEVGNERGKGFERDAADTCAIALEMKYAEKFSVKEFPWGYEMEVRFSADSSSSQRFFLLRDSSAVEAAHGEGVAVVPIPLTRFATNSTTHLEFFRLLGGLPSLCGLCNADYVYSDSIRQCMSDGRVVPLGNSLRVNEEQLLLANPQLLFLSDVREMPTREVCPQVVCAEWRERTALGRAEWIKFFALFFDKLSLADSLFCETEANYLALKSLANTDTVCPKVFAAGSYGDTWYLTGGEGYMSSLYEDANADFLLSDTTVGTVTCGLEWLLAHFSGADIWMNCQAERFDELDGRLAMLRSYKNREVYNFGKRSVKRANVVVSDFYESAVAHPDWILADVVSVFHPTLLPGYETRYVSRLK